MVLFQWENCWLLLFKDISSQGLRSSLLALETHPSWVPVGEQAITWNSF